MLGGVSESFHPGILADAVGGKQHFHFSTKQYTFHIDHAAFEIEASLEICPFLLAYLVVARDQGRTTDRQTNICASTSGVSH